MIFTVVFASLMLIAMVFAYVALNFYSPDTFEVEIDPTALEYYHETYTESREAFVSASLQLKTHFDSVLIFKTAVKSHTDTGLYVDYCYIPGASNPPRLLILSSGVHGVEGFVGSAVQLMFMEEFLDEELGKQMGILFIHGLNPYGFKHYRRFTENNVDLNRNWDIDKSLFATPNPGYFRFNTLINPQHNVNVGSLCNRFFILKAALMMINNTIEFARQSILQGQYEYQDGLYFGGMDFEPQVYTVRSVLEEICADYQIIFNIDLHTGYGKWGVLHFFPNPVKDSLSRVNVEHLFRDYRIDWGDAEKFYIITGGFPTFIGKLNPGKLFLPMTFEYGTMGSQSFLGSLKSLHIVIVENQGHIHGYEGDRDKTEIIDQFNNMYFPESEAWRTQIINVSRETFDVLIPRYESLEIEKRKTKNENRQIP